MPSLTPFPKKRVEKNRYIGLDPGDDAMRGWGFNSPGRGGGLPVESMGPDGPDVLCLKFLFGPKKGRLFF